MRTATCMGYGMPRHDVRLSHTYVGAKLRRSDVACFLCFLPKNRFFVANYQNNLCISNFCCKFAENLLYKNTKRNMENIISTNKPQLIVLTPVRNEAWVLRAFLSATSLWADHIIIADQMSTDGSREIYKDFPKVQVIDNNRQEMHQAATRILLFDAAREYLHGETNAILFALDADEFLAGNFIQSSSWNKIINSKPGDIFLWSWMYLKSNDISLFSKTTPYYWAANMSEDIWNGEFPDNFIHEWRLPWPQGKDYSYGEKLLDFYSIHLARVNVLRQQNKHVSIKFLL